MIRRVTTEELGALTLEVSRVYKLLFPEVEIITPQMVLRYQRNMVMLAFSIMTDKRRRKEAKR